MMARKNVRSTSRQIEMLVDYMSTHTNFANSEYSGPRGRQRQDEEWVHVQNLLKEYGPSKTVEQWRTTWRDLKKKARADGGRANAARVLTGNQTIIPTLSETSLKILNIIGTESAYGMAGQRETQLGATIAAQPAQATSPSPPPARSPPPATTPPPATSLLPPNSPPDTPQPSTSSTTLQNIRRRRRTRILINEFLADISNSNRERNALVERKMRRRHSEKLQQTRMDKHRHMGPKNFFF